MSDEKRSMRFNVESFHVKIVPRLMEVVKWMNKRLEKGSIF